MKELINLIAKVTNTYNRDNITRTWAYQQYYERNKEIQWAFLASMVSRNAGWHMTDLEGEYMPKILSEKKRRDIFLTYEKANWFIFHDAFPQLLIYEHSIKQGKPLFHLLPSFHVSAFMIKEWERFWVKQDEERIMIALIVNEQWTIQKQVIRHPYYSQHIFSSAIYKGQELFRLNYILFPTLTGKLYGCCVTKFKKVEKRIELGKRLMQILFHPLYYPQFYRFSTAITHTGSRLDYEQYLSEKKKNANPFLREVYPIICHERESCEDWFSTSMNVEVYFEVQEFAIEQNVTEKFLQKQQCLYLLSELISHDKRRE